MASADSHPFDGADDYAGDYKHWRQDYYYRYDTGIQLGLLGDSLMGWMVWDQMRAIDVLLARPGVDPDRIIMLGAVAGGGDPCAITAALDSRIAATVPFNFGGPQPETVFPLPDDAETSFNYLVGSYWDSTRGLYRTAAGGYFHWLITSSIAPRRLIHSHEFSWDGERDPVWKRYQRIYGEFYGAPDNLAAAHGKGLLRGKAPEASHCGQIGRYHRRMIHPAFKTLVRDRGRGVFRPPGYGKAALLDAEGGGESWNRSTSPNWFPDWPNSASPLHGSAGQTSPPRCGPGACASAGANCWARSKVTPLRNSSRHISTTASPLELPSGGYVSRSNPISLSLSSSSAQNPPLGSCQSSSGSPIRGRLPSSNTGRQ